MIEETNDSSAKLQNHLKLLKNEYSKLQKSHNELQKKLNELEANSGTAGNDSFNSRLVLIVKGLYGRKSYSDLTIKLKDKTFTAHKFVLNARSEEWREEILADVTELDWSNLDGSTADALLRWIYTDIVDLNQQDSLSMNLLKAAHKFKLNGLLGLCERALMSTANVRSCVSFYCVAEEVGATNLIEYCSSLISIHWDELLAKDFENMSETLLYKMLKSKTKFPLHSAIRLNREDVVFLFLTLAENEGTDIVNSLSEQGILPLQLALIEKNSGIANTLMNGNANINAVNAEGSTLLIDAIKRSDEFSARYLLDHNCDVNAITKDNGDTALHIICTYSKESASNSTYKEMLDVGRKILGRKDLDINKQNSKGYSPLHLAIISGHLDMIDELMKNENINLNLLTNDGKCALLLALLSHQFTDFSVAKRLIDNGAQTNNIDENGDNILQFLIKAHRDDVAVFICDYVDLNYKNYDNLTALHLASKYNLVSVVKKLLSCGASPNIQTGIEELKTALHYAIDANNFDIVQAFVDFNSNPLNSEGVELPDFNIRCFNGDTPLSLALSLKHNDMVPILIKGGSDVNARNGELTLLHQAILKESAETAIFLLEQGADFNALTGDQESCLELAIHCRLEPVVEALCAKGVALSSPNILWSALETEQENIASILVKHGIDTDCWSIGSEGMLQTLLHRAIEEQNQYAAKFLIRSGCDLDSPRQAPNEDVSPTTKESPLHMCCIHGLADVVQELIEHGANINSLNHENKTPLHLAIENQYEQIIKILLRHPNIDMKMRDKQGNTPFATALIVRNHKAAEKILERMPTAAEQTDSRGRNFLHLAIMREDLESVLFLLSIQVDVNSRVHDVNQITPLMLAAQCESEIIIRNLILAGARLNDKDSTQKTALHIAAERGKLCALQALLQNGCDYDAVDGEGNNALHIAMRECVLPIVRELLTESRINAEVLNIKGRNPLHELCRCGRDNVAASICELFLECMPNYPINQPDLLGNTPLLLSYTRGETQLCRVLVKSGACLGAENKDGVSIFNYKLATNQLLYRLLDELSVESPWSSSDFCQECATKFSLTMRKHHCRHCGRQICSQCSNNDVPIIKFGINKPVRVCRICFDVLQVGSH